MGYFRGGGGKFCEMQVMSLRSNFRGFNFLLRFTRVLVPITLRGKFVGGNFHDL